MLYSDLYGKLILLTNRNNITHAEIGKCIGIERGAIFARAKRNSKFKPDEIKKIEQHFGISFNDIKIVEKNKTEFNPVSDDYVKIALESWGKRLFVLQTTAGFNTKEFSKFLDIPHERLQEYIENNTYPTGEDLLKIKTKFSKTSLDWVLFGVNV